MTEITSELILVVCAWFCATLTTWGLVLYVKRRVNQNGAYINSKIEGFEKRVNAFQLQVSTMRKGMEDSFSHLTQNMPDLSQGVQFDMQAMAQQLAPLLQETMANTLNGMKGAEKKSLQKAAVMLQEGFEELQHDEFLADVAAGVPDAIQIANAAGFLQQVLPGIIEKSPDGIIAQYGPVLTENAGKLYQLRKQRQQGVVVQGSQRQQQGGFRPGIQ